jgi:D-tyrosyl-tRNA(Tyr) deacylase
VLRKMFEHKREEVTEDRRKLDNEKLLTIHNTGDRIKEVDMGGT